MGEWGMVGVWNVVLLVAKRHLNGPSCAVSWFYCTYSTHCRTMKLLMHSVRLAVTN